MRTSRFFSGGLMVFAVLLTALTVVIRALAEEPVDPSQGVTSAAAGSLFNGKELEEKQLQPEQSSSESGLGLSESKNPGAIFKPTETVSEDLSVPFPVDI